MRFEVSEEPLTALGEYAAIPISFEVSTVFDVAERGDRAGAFVLTERGLDAPYVKDYDAAGGEDPTSWAARFDVSRWGLLAARAEGRRVGGAAVAFDTPGLDMLEGRRDLAVLWDIRVSPEARGRGVGCALFRAAEAWAGARGCRRLKVETQNINVPACRFYMRQGCVLGAVNRHAYPGLPGEIQLLWYKDIARPAQSG
jgi:ribosomal protein S18 acetylase RimI-like enzyme